MELNMSGDYSRIDYKTSQNYHGVLLQQGRPLTDRDWNDLVAQTNRRLQTATLDTLGKTAISTVTDKAFEITGDNTTGLMIAPGRMYVDGLLAENHGFQPLKWDPVLAELRGTKPVPFDHQLYMPDVKTPKSGGPYLIYLDVWQREVTQYEDQGLVEKALGVDTTTRLQTIWQVKSLDLSKSKDTSGGSISCATANEDIPDFARSAGLLTISTGDVKDDNPCLVPPLAGYKGLENQLYRIEIHDPGPVGTATFKWSRENASVTARVRQIKNANTIVVDSTGKDAVLRFSEGDWIEITDDHQELKGLPGDLRKIKIGGGVVDATGTITLDTSMTLTFSPDADGNVDPSRNVRICRWDQKHKIKDDKDIVQFDLDAGGDGAIKVPAAGVKLHIENGIYASFNVDVTGGQFHTGDYWVTAARTSDGTVDQYTKLHPLGIHHHYAKLAVFTPPTGLTPCITKPVKPDDTCCCVSVAPDGDIQSAIDSLDDVYGGCVCLKPGKHTITKTLTITTNNVVLKGESLGAIIYFDSADPILTVGNGGDAADRVNGIEISTITFERSQLKGPALISFNNVDDGIIQDCVVSKSEYPAAIGVSINDSTNLRVLRCAFKSVYIGVFVAAREESHDLLIADNTIDFGQADSAGVELKSTDNIPVGNIWTSAGIFIMPVGSAPIYRVSVTGNTIERHYAGIVVFEAIEVDIARNTIVGATLSGSFGIILFEVAFGQVHDNATTLVGFGCFCLKGIVLDITGNAMLNGVAGIFMLEQVQPSCAQNRIGNMMAAGIVTAGNLGRCDIVENRISACGFASLPHSGIFAYLILGDLHIKANEIINTGFSLSGQQAQSAVAGIAAFFVMETTVEGNLVTYLGAVRQFIADDRALLMLGLFWEFPAMITANKFTGWGQSLVQLIGMPYDRQIIGFASVFFSNNYCSHLPLGIVGSPIIFKTEETSDPSTEDNPSPASVMLTAITATVMGNQIKAYTTVYPSLLLWKIANATVMGNITTGVIEAGASALPQPLSSFNAKI
jgi:hypothetical protein